MSGYDPMDPMDQIHVHQLDRCGFHSDGLVIPLRYSSLLMRIDCVRSRMLQEAFGGHK